MHKYRNRIFAGIIVTLVIYVGLLFVLDSSGQFTEELVEQLNRFPLWVLVPLVVIQIGAGFFRFLEWHYYLGVIDARHKISLLDSAIIFVSTFTMAVSPGKIAEIGKSVLLKMKTDVPVARSAPIIIAERVVDGLAVIITVAITLIVAGDRLELGEYRVISQGIIFLSAGLLALGLVAVQIAPLMYFFLNILERLPLINRLHSPLTVFYESSREVFKLRHIILTTLMGMGVYVCGTLSFMVTMWAFGTELSWTLFWQSAFIVGVVSAIGALSFVPNGAGITEISATALILAVITPANPIMTPVAAAAAALIQGFFHKWFRVVAGLGVAVVFRQRLFTPGLEAEITAIEHSRSVGGKSPAYSTERA
jgi:glycosyltransferase 2 family protein